MAHNIEGKWSGVIQGTNQGRVFVEIQQDESNLQAKVHINDHDMGVYSYYGAGRIEDDHITLNLQPGDVTPSMLAGPVTGDARLIAANTIKGSWSSTIGTIGEFVVYRSTEDEYLSSSQEANVPTLDSAFVMMSMREDDPSLEDVLDAIKRSCQANNIEANRVDEIEHLGRITDQILSAIKNHRILICDISSARPNVYYELGFAHGLGRSVILLAKQGTVLHFDIKDYNTIFYKNMKELESKLGNRLHSIIDGKN